MPMKYTKVLELMKQGWTRGVVGPGTRRPCSELQGRQRDVRHPPASPSWKCARFVKDAKPSRTNSSRRLPWRQQSRRQKPSMAKSYKRIRPAPPTPPPPSKENVFLMPGEPRRTTRDEFTEILRLLSAYTYTPTQAEHAAVILKGQTRT
jgi:hypothetical protein